MVMSLLSGLGGLFGFGSFSGITNGLGAVDVMAAGQQAMAAGLRASKTGLLVQKDLYDQQAALMPMSKNALKFAAAATTLATARFAKASAKVKVYETQMALTNKWINAAGAA